MAMEGFIGNKVSRFASWICGWTGFRAAFRPWPVRDAVLAGYAEKFFSTRVLLDHDDGCVVDVCLRKFWKLVVTIILCLVGWFFSIEVGIILWCFYLIGLELKPRENPKRVITSDTTEFPEATLFVRLESPQDVKWREPPAGVTIKCSSEYAVKFASQFGLELSDAGYHVDGSTLVLMPKVSSCMIGDSAYFYPRQRHVVRTCGMFDLVDLSKTSNVIRFPGLSIGFIGTTWGLVDNDTYARCKNMTYLSVDSCFNAVTEIKTSAGRSWCDVWTLAYITEERRLAREVIPDAPLSTRVRLPPRCYSSEWVGVNKARRRAGLSEVAEVLFQTSYFKKVELFSSGSPYALEVEERVVPDHPPVLVKETPVALEIIDSGRPGPADLTYIDESQMEELQQLETNSESQLSFIKGTSTRKAVEYVVSGGKVIMNPNVITSEMKEYSINPDDWKTRNERRVVYGQSFGKMGYSPAPTSHVSLLTERLRQKPLTPATKKVDLTMFNMGSLDLQTLKINLPAFEGLKIEDIGECEEKLNLRVKEMNNSMTRQRMSRVLSEFYGCMIEVLSVSRSKAKWTGDLSVKLVNIEVKIFTKGDELVMKAKPRSIKFPKSWFWLVSVLNLEAQIAAIKSDPYWSWQPDPKVPFRLYWASGMTQELLSRAWTHAISNLPSYKGEGGEYFSFICGDDNSDELGAADASSYDMTQRQFFAKCQFDSMKGFESVTLKTLQKIHKGKRFGKGFSYIQKEMGNPSGSPFTLFINSLGMGIYTLERARVRLMVQKRLDRAITPHEMDILSKEVGKGYGLEITYTCAPEVGQVGEGIEFLKGVFVYSSFVDLDKPIDQLNYVWVPLPSRILKCGKIIVDNPNLEISPAHLDRQLSSVALSYKSAITSPLLDEWVKVWARNVSGDLPKTWMNVTYESSPEFLRLGESAAFKGKMLEVFAHRYGMSMEELRTLQSEIREKGRVFGSFLGGLWDRLSLVDYQGMSYQGSS